MRREIFNIKTICEPVDIAGFAHDPSTWLAQQMQKRAFIFLLAHTDDGVIWGRLDREGLITSHDVAPEDAPPLREKTLQTVRIFGPEGELFIWRGELGVWAGRLITETTSDTSPDWEQAFEEQHIVWGTRTKSLARDFTLMCEGSQGIVHVVPLKVTRRIDEQHRPLRLVVRHYVKAEESGFLRVDASRLHSLIQTEESNS